MSSNAEGIKRAFAAERRARLLDIRLGSLRIYPQHLELHILPPEKFEMTRVIHPEVQCSPGSRCSV